MGSTSMSNPNPWSPYDSYNDCSQGICNIYCPQWCYFIFPPPPPSYENTSSSNFSPLLIALIGVLVSAFILISYYTLISKYCHRHNSSSFSSESPGVGFVSSERRQGDGLNESVIKSITVYKYRKGDGFVDCSDCSVCLSEFEENESLRLLPKCNHAFHLPCIDTWLKSHSNCPLCRAFVTTTEVDRGKGTTEISSSIAVNRTSDSVTDLEMEPRNMQPIRRSVSLNSSGLVVSISDVLGDIQDDSAGTSCNERSGVSSFLVKSSVTMKRSLSTGRFIFSRSCDRGGRNDGLPI